MCIKIVVLSHINLGLKAKYWVDGRFNKLGNKKKGYIYVLPIHAYIII